MRRFAALAIATFAAAGCQNGERREAPPPAPQESLTLFNGEDLTGWDVWLAANDRGGETFTARGGVLHCTGTPAGYIQTEDLYESFELELEWRWAGEPGNSGVLLRKGAEDELWPRSFEAQLMHGSAGDIVLIGGFEGTLSGERAEGRVRRKRVDAEKPAGDWNQYRIVLDGPEAALFVNGQRVNEASGLAVRPGRICLQSEGAPIQFRNIRLTPLD